MSPRRTEGAARLRAPLRAAWLLGLLAPAVASAALVLPPLPAGQLRTDAYFQDWQAAEPLRVLPVQGACDSADFAPTVQLAFDGTHLRFAVQVRDERFVPGAATGDRLRLKARLPSGRRRTLEVLLNDLEPPKAARLMLDGKPYRRGEIAATARRDGWAVEGSWPLADLPGVDGTPFALAVVLEDADADPTQIEAVCATAALGPDGFPQAPTVDLGGLSGFEAAFLDERPGAVLRRAQGNLAGDRTAELALLTDKDLMVAGHALPGGVAGFVYFSHGWPMGTTVSRFELTELDGQPGLDILLVRQSWLVPDETRVDVAEVYRMDGTTLRRTFAAQLAEHAPPLKADALARLQIAGARGARQLWVHPAKVTGFNPGNVIDLSDGGRAFWPLPWPWATRRPVRYQWRGDAWAPNPAR